MSAVVEAAHQQGTQGTSSHTAVDEAELGLAWDALNSLRKAIADLLGGDSGGQALGGEEAIELAEAMQLMAAMAGAVVAGSSTAALQRLVRLCVRACVCVCVCVCAHP